MKKFFTSLLKITTIAFFHAKTILGSLWVPQLRNKKTNWDRFFHDLTREHMILLSDKMSINLPALPFMKVMRLKFSVFAWVIIVYKIWCCYVSKWLTLMFIIWWSWLLRPDYSPNLSAYMQGSDTKLLPVSMNLARLLWRFLRLPYYFLTLFISNRQDLKNCV